MIQELAQPMPIMMTVYGGMEVDNSAIVINPYTVMSIPAVWRGVNYLANNFAGLDRSVYKTVGENKKKVPHYLNTILNRRISTVANPFDVYRTLLHHAIIWGNGYCYINRDKRTNAIIGIHNLNPEMVTPFRIWPDDGSEPQQWYKVGGFGAVDGPIVPASSIIHLKGLGYDGMVGYPLVYLLAEAFEHAKIAIRFGTRYLKKGTHLQGSVEIPFEATDEQIQQIKAQVKAYHSGIQSDYSHIVLSGGAKLTNNTVPPEQTQLLETLQFDVDEIGRILSVSPIILYSLGRATWNNAEIMRADVRDSLRSWVEQDEQESSSKLLTSAEQDNNLFILNDLDGMLRSDPDSRTANSVQLVNNGLITPNEGRNRLDIGPSTDPNADKLRIPTTAYVPGIVDSAAAEVATAPKAPVAKVQNSSIADAKVAFEALEPVIKSLCDRIEHKTEKAFSNKASKKGNDLVVWSNVFAEEQCKGVKEALEPLCFSFKTLSGLDIDVDTIASNYASVVRGKAAGREVKSLYDLVTLHIGGNNRSSNEVCG